VADGAEQLGAPGQGVRGAAGAGGAAGAASRGAGSGGCARVPRGLHPAGVLQYAAPPLPAAPPLSEAGQPGQAAGGSQLHCRLRLHADRAVGCWPV